MRRRLIIYLSDVDTQNLVENILAMKEQVAVLEKTFKKLENGCDIVQVINDNLKEKVLALETENQELKQKLSQWEEPLWKISPPAETSVLGIRTQIDEMLKGLV